MINFFEIFFHFSGTRSESPGADLLVGGGIDAVLSRKSTNKIVIPNWLYLTESLMPLCQ